MSKLTPDKISDIAKNVRDIVITKNETYGDSVSKSAKLMHVLYPDGIAPSHYDDAHLIIRVLDKLSRLASADITKRAKYDAWQDIAGYGIIGASNHEEG